MVKERISLTVDRNWLTKVDYVRGLIPRSRFIQAKVEEELKND